MTLTEELSTMPNNRQEAATHLQSDWGGCSVSFQGWPGTTVAVKKDKKEIMADAVGAKKIAERAEIRHERPDLQGPYCR